MATCSGNLKTMGVLGVKNERALIYALAILLAISMYTNDNCEVKEASEVILQPFFPRAQSETWER